MFKKKLLLLSVKLAAYLRKNSCSPRIGVVLPPGLLGVVANLGILFAGKVPVNLNFSLGSNIAERLINKAEISTIISAQKMVDKFPDFPWTNDLFEISSWLKNLASSPYLLFFEAIMLKFPIPLLAILSNTNANFF